MDASFSLNESNDLLIKYKLEFNNFIKISKYDLILWKDEYTNSNEHPLNVLYRRFEIIK